MCVCLRASAARARSLCSWPCRPRHPPPRSTSWRRSWPRDSSRRGRRARPLTACLCASVSSRAARASLLCASISSSPLATPLVPRPVPSRFASARPSQRPGL
eukprot:2571407-Pleurochrysis_carterae.AAC.1